MARQIKPGRFEVQATHNVLLLNRGNNENILSISGIGQNPKVNNVVIGDSPWSDLVAIHGRDFSGVRCQY